MELWNSIATMGEEDKKREAMSLSVLICSTLDHLGYKKENIISRCKFNEEVVKKIDLKRCGLNVTQVIVGSMGEGVGLSDSDGDGMIVFENVVCVDHGNVVGHLIVLETDYINTSPGYTKVIALDLNRPNPLQYFMFSAESVHRSTDGYPYVSSAGVKCVGLMAKEMAEEFLPVYFGLGSDYSNTFNGPAVTSSFKVKNIENSIESDMVLAVYFYGSDVLPKWTNRARFNIWPSRETVEEISDMEGYIVPVGDKQSENSNLEWRICYTTAEMKLVSSLNNVQIKLYVLLKLFAKRVLKPVCKGITSYVVKNVVFWTLEMTQYQHMSSECLVTLFQNALFFIKNCLENNHLPNYMIPERNLLQGCVFGQAKQTAIHFISDCLNEGGFIIMRLPRLLECILQNATFPESLIFYGTWRDEVEKQEEILCRLAMEHFNFPFINGKVQTLKKLFSACSRDRRFKKEIVRYFNLIVPEWRHLMQNGHSEEIQKLYLARAGADMLL